ncbi:MAG: phosphatase PAP2 family protein [Fibrobacter sp.]|uniref:phosphatase PAP2 family protein n=1 Tax=Fibrobacter sp. TaxID=35828 RepID=UPI0025C23F82|nr:phosphatase PAP2 family protein [Fibrobacter sp.]MBQ3715284.1 phosphatase PAP2 family protein [Fibrobacter sp.]MBQ3777909.1 phosphatase PAP2 family protein [Fibrobacter sp.]MBQ7078089.1 phosphatase PAP2 family protein [Fibrobacter sp.]
MKSLLCSILLATSFALAQEADSSAQELSPFDHLGHNMLGSAFSWPLGFHMLGGALTYRLSMEDKDLMVARFAARQNEIVYGIAFTPGMLMGTFGPFLIPGYMYFISNNKALNNTGAVAAQATAVAFLYNNILKAVSGRAHPDAENNTGELSRDFKWGFGRRGVFYGWPSGHSMTNASLAMSIASYHRDNPWVVAGCGLYAGYIATSMVLGAKGEAHWFSDAVAGTLMGASIGWYIGNTFYKEKQGKTGGTPKVTVAPLFYDDTKGAVVSLIF